MTKLIDCPSKIKGALFENRVIGVTEKLYHHMMEVLPPRDIGYNNFTFQEGDGDIYYFQKSLEEYYCSYKYADLYTDDFKLSVSGVFNIDNDNLIIKAAWFMNETPENMPLSKEQLENLIGQEFKNINAFKEAYNLNLRT